MTIKNKKLCSQNTLIWLCCFVYTLAYIGRYSYNANINLIMNEYSTSHADAGLVTTFFFFAYGIGQVVNGILCKRYNKKLLFPLVLFGSSVLNLLILWLPFSFFKYLWVINGFLQSCLWSSIIHVLGTNLDADHMDRALALTSVTSTVGTFIAYGGSAFFVWLGNYRITFIFAAVMMSLIGVLWLWLFSDAPIYKPMEKREQKESKKLGGVMIVLITLAFFAVIDNLVKDGVNTWMPTLLAENYGMKDETSILSSVVLPILGTFGALLSLKLNRLIKDFVALIVTMLAVSSLFLCIVLFFEVSSAVIAVMCFGILACMMSGINNVITSIAPLKMRDKVDSGRMAGILNGFCYMGSTVSAYGLGAIADRGGWDAAFYLLLGACAVGIVIGAVYIICAKIKKTA
ncbi:MAG: MFS transporter [Ruminococcaceae bacterium]|nr:MFS transporter [Oscillospiraceae bacterium]